MKNQNPSISFRTSGLAPIIIIFIVVVLLAGGILAWQYFGAPEEEVGTSGGESVEPAPLKSMEPAPLKSMEPEPFVGGPCSYNEFQGSCKIISIFKTEASMQQAGVVGGPGYEGFEVEFAFTPNKPLNLKNTGWANEENNILNQNYPLQLTNSWYPGPKYLEKYHIKKSAVFGCKLELRTKGTCSPKGFKFDDIKTGDYFETEALKKIDTERPEVITDKCSIGKDIVSGSESSQFSCEEASNCEWRPLGCGLEPNGPTECYFACCPKDLQFSDENRAVYGRCFKLVD